MLTILGITHLLSGNSAAALLIDGIPKAMAEEERFIRRKFAINTLPQHAIEYCLSETGVNWNDIDLVAVGYSEARTIFLKRVQQLIQSGQFTRIPSAYTKLKNRLLMEKRIISLAQGKELVFVRHHLAHAASAFFASGFQKSVILTLDGAGGEESGMLSFGEGRNITKLESISNDFSWGLAWALVTEHLGLRGHQDEGHVMGLAASGAPQYAEFPFVDWTNPIPKIDLRDFTEFLSKFPKRRINEEFSDEHKDLAASIQKATEITIERALTYAYHKTGSNSYCMSGGVMLNCVSNGKVSQLPFVKEIFIQPASNDAGVALGAALYSTTMVTKERPAWRQKHVYFGPSYESLSIEKALEISAHGNNFKPILDLSEIARLLANNCIVGWFQGRMEFGPRALGARSILADPRKAQIRDRVNRIKGRALWRPLSPSILEEEIDTFIEGQAKFPHYMIVAYPASPRAIQDIPATVHVDNTIRPQAVSKNITEKYWSLINSFRQLTGVPALLNTSFNVAGEPIVCSPEDAITTFMQSELDYLVIGDFLVWK